MLIHFFSSFCTCFPQMNDYNHNQNMKDTWKDFFQVCFCILPHSFYTKKTQSSSQLERF